MSEKPKNISAVQIPEKPSKSKESLAINREAVKRREALKRAEFTEETFKQEKPLLKRDTEILISETGKGSRLNRRGWKGLVWKDDPVRILESKIVKIDGEKYVEAEVTHMFKGKKAGRSRKYIGYLKVRDLIEGEGYEKPAAKPTAKPAAKPAPKPEAKPAAKPEKPQKPEIMNFYERDLQDAVSAGFTDLMKKYNWDPDINLKIERRNGTVNTYDIYIQGEKAGVIFNQNKKHFARVEGLKKGRKVYGKIEDIDPKFVAGKTAELLATLIEKRKNEIEAERFSMKNVTRFLKDALKGKLHEGIGDYTYGGVRILKPDYEIDGTLKGKPYKYYGRIAPDGKSINVEWVEDGKIQIKNLPFEINKSGRLDSEKFNFRIDKIINH